MDEADKEKEEEEEDEEGRRIVDSKLGAATAATVISAA